MHCVKLNTCMCVCVCREYIRWGKSIENDGIFTKTETMNAFCKLFLKSFPLIEEPENFLLYLLWK